MTTHQDIPARATRRHLPTWAKLLIGIAIAMIMLPLVVAAVFLWSFSGGWDGIRPQPEPDDRRVVRARERVGAPLDRFTAQTLQVVGGTELVRARTDRCEQGQNNWKIHNGYKLRCERADVVVLSASDSGVAAAASRLDGALRAAGREPTYDGAGLGEPVSGGRVEGSYQGTAGPEQSISMTVLTGGTGYLADPLPTYDNDSIEGDADGVRAALREPGALRVVVQTTVRYFED